MPFQNKKSQTNELKNKKTFFTEKIAFLSALSLFFSYAEMILPRFTPFFKIGLANIVILYALDFDFLPFLTLILVKSVANCIFSGTLFSPFFLISLLQSFFSGIFMFFLNKINNVFGKKFLSLYGVSILGSAASAIAQIFLSSVYLGRGTYSLLGPMLIFSIFSGFLTAFACNFLHIPQDFKISNDFFAESGSFSSSSSSDFSQNAASSSKTSHNNTNRLNFLKKSRFLVAFIVILSIFVFFLKNVFVATIFLFLSFFLQIIFGRKIKIAPHISIWIFVILTALFVPSGKVLFKIGRFSVTQGALFAGILKSLKLSTAASFSQSITTFDFIQMSKSRKNRKKTSKNAENCNFNEKNQKIGGFSLVMIYFSQLQNRFRTSKGTLCEKIKKTLDFCSN